MNTHDTTNAAFDRIAEAWLADGPGELADRVLDSALREIHQTRQRRPLASPWRNRPMPFFSTNLGRAATAVVAAVVVIGGAIYLLGGRPGVGGPSPVPSQTAVAEATTAAPTTAPSIVVRPPRSAFTESFTSSQYGFTVKYPKGWTVRPAKETFRGGEIPSAEATSADAISSGEMEFYVVAEPVAAGTTEAQWTASIDPRVPRSFGFAANCAKSATALTVDGEAATELAFDVCRVATFMWVTTVHAGYGYQIVWTDYAFTPLADAQGVFDSFLSTFTFTR
jgi:hypothetical protein